MDPSRCGVGEEPGYYVSIDKYGQPELQVTDGSTLPYVIDGCVRKTDCPAGEEIFYSQGVIKNGVGSIPLQQCLKSDMIKFIKAKMAQNAKDRKEREAQENAKYAKYAAEQKAAKEKEAAEEAAAKIQADIDRKDRAVSKIARLKEELEKRIANPKNAVSSFFSFGKKPLDLVTMPDLDALLKKIQTYDSSQNAPGWATETAFQNFMQEGKDIFTIKAPNAAKAYPRVARLFTDRKGKDGRNLFTLSGGRRRTRVRHSKTRRAHRARHTRRR